MPGRRRLPASVALVLAGVLAPQTVLHHDLDLPSWTPPEPVPDLQWSPPPWLPTGEDAWALPEMSGDGPLGPALRSRAAFVYDIDRGSVLVARRADDRRPAASLTKLVAALAMRAEDPDLDAPVCIDAEHYPTRSGARSKLHTGDCATGHDLLGAALVASDNRAAYALATVAGLGLDDFVDHMNTRSRELSMLDSEWADPAGLEDDNLSTARDLARAVLAVAADPVLAEAASAPSWTLDRLAAEGPRPRLVLLSTNRQAEHADLQFLAAKTGFTNTARYCLAAVVSLRDGSRLAVAVLGAEKSRHRWDDLERLVRHAERQRPPR